jgi:hypothetical protein
MPVSFQELLVVAISNLTVHFSLQNVKQGTGRIEKTTCLKHALPCSTFFAASGGKSHCASIWRYS